MKLIKVTIALAFTVSIYIHASRASLLARTLPKPNHICNDVNVDFCDVDIGRHAARVLKRNLPRLVDSLNSTIKIQEDYVGQYDMALFRPMVITALQDEFTPRAYEMRRVNITRYITDGLKSYSRLLAFLSSFLEWIKSLLSFYNIYEHAPSIPLRKIAKMLRTMYIHFGGKEPVFDDLCAGHVPIPQFGHGPTSEVVYVLSILYQARDNIESAVSFIDDIVTLTPNCHMHCADRVLACHPEKQPETEKPTSGPKRDHRNSVNRGNKRKRGGNKKSGIKKGHKMHRNC